MLSQTRAAVLASIDSQSIDPLGVSGGPGVELVPEMTVARHSPDGVVGSSPLWKEGMETAKDLRNILRWMCREVWNLPRI